MGTTDPYRPAAAQTVSVVIPTYNRASLLERAVQSCFAQEIAVHEILVCDDGSTDDSQARMAALGDTRVKWLPGAHAGRPAVPRNRGVSTATGTWLAFLDSDDAWVPGKLARQLDLMASTGAEACCGNAERILPTGTSAGPYISNGLARLDLPHLLKVNRVICSSAVVKRSLVLEAGGFPEAAELKALEDYALWLRIAAHTPFDYCAEPLVRYADDPGSSVRATSVEVSVQRDMVLSDLLQWDGHKKLSSGQRRAVARHLRRARRNAGRPIKDWLFLR